MRNHKYLVIMISVGIFVIFHEFTLQILLSNRPKNLKRMSEVEKLQKSMRRQKWKIWKNRRKEFKDKLLDIKEPIPENIEAKMSLSLEPFYQSKMSKVSL